MRAGSGCVPENQRAAQTDRNQRAARPATGCRAVPGPGLQCYPTLTSFVMTAAEGSLYNEVAGVLGGISTWNFFNDPGVFSLLSPRVIEV